MTDKSRARAGIAPSGQENMARQDSPAVPSPSINLVAGPAASNSLSASGHRSSVRRRFHGSPPAERPNIIEGTALMRPIQRPPPGDTPTQRKSQPEINKKRSAYFENEFAAPHRDTDPIKAQALNEAIVMAELKTNVIVEDEFRIITDLSCQLSVRYQRPMSSIIVSLVHSSCMMFGGSFDSAYTITIHTLPDLIQPSLNKRNAALIQRHLQESLGVVAARGYVHFVACPAENVAIAGKTIAADMGDVNQVRRNEKTGGSAKTSKIGRKLSAKSLKNFRSSSTLNLADRVAAPAPHHSGETTRIATIPEVPATAAEDEKPGECAQRGPSRTPSLRKTLRILGILPQRAGEGRSRTPGPDR